MGSYAKPWADSLQSCDREAAPQNEKHRLHIDRRGVWWYDGAAFVRKEMVCLLASCLRKTSNGYEVALPNDPRPIPVDVDDVPFLAVEVFSAGEGRDSVLSFRTNIDQIIPLGPEFPLYLAEDPATGENIPYISIGNGMSARLSRPVFYELAALAEVKECDGKDEVGVWSNQQFFILGSLI